MQQAVERGEVLESLLFDDGLQVEFDVSLAADERTVAQQTQGLPLVTMPHRCSVRLRYSWTSVCGAMRGGRMRVPLRPRCEKTRILHPLQNLLL